MKVKIVWNNRGEIITEVVDKVEGDLAIGYNQLIPDGIPIQAPENHLMYEDDFGLFYVPVDALISEEICGDPSDN